ncbi:bifunctional phosphoribosyl-AMP cyclohydrolase/phosphoribosyl-ATP diphosphatase HisIE [Caloramator sp. E03]|uniref:bifunctional phosphoribosyl-AMP cyclohydrolase/phosphoribosyl-ATP diphosphatase HisIE n=1 Tax=Caloramator sp. E03 TaxID=2576307 RepID=UPI001110D2D6|nr:bifunctional phosphoribosyl-AMP cyclohydrolase/phosphoribosyl-ATP diphosphatase HisIE [Caloramator sp. E03]QCX34566.1 bifunctional phosphoribosyl-AMP cyclohydrolase/phosphoribosyl-ATP diphosphatase HisIE [Caloramator sp. E03]
MTLQIKFDDNGLIPAIIQDEKSKKVLMLAYMNEESIEKTITTGTTWFYSRSRKKLWNKGETSGNYQKVKRISFDCDCDTVLIEVEPLGNACHTGSSSCFFNEFYVDEDKSSDDKEIIINLYERIMNRKQNPKEGSYTNYLFNKGIDKILKKVGEESSEVIIASKNDSREEMIYEISDLLYHVLVLMVDKGISIEDIKKEIKRRYEK